MRRAFSRRKQLGLGLSSPPTTLPDPLTFSLVAVSLVVCMVQTQWAFLAGHFDVLFLIEHLTLPCCCTIS